MFRYLVIFAIAVGLFNPLCCCDVMAGTDSRADAGVPVSGCCGANTPDGDEQSPAPGECPTSCSAQYCAELGPKDVTSAMTVPGLNKVRSVPSMEVVLRLPAPAHEVHRAFPPAGLVAATQRPLSQVHCVYLL